MAELGQSGASSAGGKRSRSGRAADGRSSADSRPAAGDGGSRSREDRSPGADQIRALYEQAESSSAQAFEEFVSKPSFGWLLARSAENVAALSRMGADFGDLVWRAFRVASRADVTRLARQLHRTEDKLERVLQEVEQLRDELDAGDRPRRSNGRTPRADEPAKAQRAKAQR
jgi:hypothetical protein